MICCKDGSRGGSLVADGRHREAQTGVDDARSAQAREMAADLGLAEPERLDEITNAYLLLSDQAQDTQKVGSARVWKRAAGEIGASWAMPREYHNICLDIYDCWF